jgi:glycosyltransferase involved in cell wall biosynthesis
MTVTSLQDAEELDTLSVIRRPAPRRQLQLARWSDIFVQSGISLRSLWLPFVARRPLAMIHHNMIFNNQGSRALSALKWAAARLGQNIAVSRAVGRNLPPSTAVIPNPFRSSLPEISSATERSGLLFVGRLVSAKGGDVALDALARLHAQEGGDAPPLTICGDGPDRAALERQARALGLQEAVTFAGWTAPRELAAHYARAEALLVPSRYEPFGIVALEALSTGTPVLTLDSPTNATRELVLDDELGETFPPRATNLAAKLERWIYRDEDPRKKTVRQQFGRVLDWNRVAERVDRLYHDVAERGAP